MLKKWQTACVSQCARHLPCGIRFSFQVNPWEDFCNFFRLKVNHDMFINLSDSRTNRAYKSLLNTPHSFHLKHKLGGYLNWNDKSLCPFAPANLALSLLSFRVTVQHTNAKPTFTQSACFVCCHTYTASWISASGIK